MATVAFWWLVPAFLAARGLYFGGRDGFLVHFPLKIWAVWWTIWLAKLLIIYSQDHVGAGDACGRETTFTALWLAGFAVVHGAAVYCVRRFELTEKAYSWLNLQPWYSRWRTADLITGSVVQAVTELGIAYYFVKLIYYPAAGTPLALVGRVADAVGDKAASFFGLQGPDYFTIDWAQQTVLHGDTTLDINACLAPQLHEPYAWLMIVWAVVIFPLFVIICLQPLLYIPIWTKRLSWNYNREGCRSCRGRGIHVYNPLLFGTVCATCRGSGRDKSAKPLGIAVYDETLDKEKRGISEDFKVSSRLVMRTYFWFLMFLCPPVLVVWLVRVLFR